MAALLVLLFLCACRAGAAGNAATPSCAAPVIARSGATVRAVRTLEWEKGFDAASVFPEGTEPTPVLLRGAPTAALVRKWDAAYLSALGETLGESTSSSLLNVRVQRSPLFMYHSSKKQLARLAA